VHIVGFIEGIYHYSQSRERQIQDAVQWWCVRTLKCITGFSDMRNITFSSKPLLGGVGWMRKLVRLTFARHYS